MSHPDIPHDDTHGDETEEERVDRNLAELLQELRVALPGIQVLFAFLLVIPFNQRFPTLSSFEENLYFATLVLTGLATALLIAPTVHHRIYFRAHRKKEIVFTASVLALAGLAVLAAAMTGAIMLITHVLFETGTAAVVGAGFSLLFAALWFGAPIGAIARLHKGYDGPEY